MASVVRIGEQTDILGERSIWNEREQALFQPLAEKFPGFDTFTWNAIAVPKGTPAARIQVLGDAMRQVLQKPEIVKRYNERGVSVWMLTQKDVADRLQRDYRNAKEIIEKRGIRSE